MQTVGTLLLGWYRSSSVHVRMITQDGRSADGSLYLRAVQLAVRSIIHCQANLDEDMFEAASPVPPLNPTGAHGVRGTHG